MQHVCKKEQEIANINNTMTDIRIFMAVIKTTLQNIENNVESLESKMEPMHDQVLKNTENINNIQTDLKNLKTTDASQTATIVKHAVSIKSIGEKINAYSGGISLIAIIAAGIAKGFGWV